MKKLLKVIFLIIFMGMHSCFGQELTLHKNIELARESFEDIYYELLKNNYFDEYYNNNLIIDTDVNHDFARNGLILFKLVEWLQQHDDRSSRYLLKRLNKLFYLELYRFVSKMDPEKVQDGKLFDALSKVYHHKVPAAHLGVSPVPPFQTTLTKAIILIFTLNAGTMFFNDKKESLVYALDLIRQEMLDINDRLGDKKVDEKDIRLVFHVLQAYAAQESIVKLGSIKKVVIGTAVIAACVGISYFILTRWKVDKTNLETGEVVIDENGNVVRHSLSEHINERISAKWNSGIHWVADQLGLLGEKVGEKLAVGAGKAMVDRDEHGEVVVKRVIKDAAAELGRDAIHGIAKKGKNHEPIPDDEKNPDLKVLGETIVDGALKGASKKMDPVIKKFTKVAGKEVKKVVKPVIEGAIRTGKNKLKRDARNWSLLRPFVPRDEPEPEEPNDEPDDKEESEE